jgi:hypothetical protein
VSTFSITMNGWVIFGKNRIGQLGIARKGLECRLWVIIPNP